MTYGLAKMKFRRPEDEKFGGSCVALSFPESYQRFLIEEANHLDMSRSAFVRIALDFYREHLEEFRSLASPRAPAVTDALLKERRAMPRIPVGAE